MKITDAYIDGILKKMGVNPNEKPHWILNYHEVIDRGTGEIIHTLPDGYICSYCGKYEYYLAEKCRGCGSIMANGKKPRR